MFTYLESFKAEDSSRIPHYLSRRPGEISVGAAMRGTHLADLARRALYTLERYV